MRRALSSIAALVALFVTCGSAAAQSLTKSLEDDLRQHGPSTYLTTYLLEGAKPSSGTLVWVGTDSFQLTQVDGQPMSYIIPFSAVSNIQKTGEPPRREIKPNSPEDATLKSVLTRNYKDKPITVFYLIGIGNHGTSGTLREAGDNYLNLRTNDNKNLLIPFTGIAFIQVSQ
jgi:hypothetical protein